MDARAHVEPERRFVKRMLFSRPIFVDFSGCQRCKLILWTKYVLWRLDMGLAGIKILLVCENGDLKKSILFSKFWNSFKTRVPAHLTDFWDLNFVGIAS